MVRRGDGGASGHAPLERPSCIPTLESGNEKSFRVVSLRANQRFILMAANEPRQLDDPRSTGFGVSIKGP